nr:MAG TPA: tail completion protein [Caudoviricetes sp.]
MQEKLIKRVGKVLENLELPTVSGERRKIKIYSQDLDIPDDEDEDIDIETATAPYVIVRITDGFQESWDSALQVNVVFIICIYAKDTNKEGTKDVMTIINKLYQSFAERPNIDEFEVEPPLEWTLQTDVDTYPYFFGAVSIGFNCPAARRIDEFA